MRTRHQELMWSALPITTSYTDPYLLVYTETSIDIYDVLIGIWLQSLPLSRTYPLTADGAVSLSYDLEVDQNCSKLIYVTHENRVTLSLNIPENFSTKSVLRRNGVFRGRSKSIKPSLDRSVVSDPTNYRHVEHIGKSDGLKILSQLACDEQSNDPSLMMQRYSLNENGPLTKLSRSGGSDPVLLSSYALDRLV
jgi:hypothetical protein